MKEKNQMTTIISLISVDEECAVARDPQNNNHLQLKREKQVSPTLSWGWMGSRHFGYLRLCLMEAQPTSISSKVFTEKTVGGGFAGGCAAEASFLSMEFCIWG